MPINESNVQDNSQQGMVKCPQCGKLVSKVFPYCEYCTFPIGEMLQHGADSNFVENELREERRQRSQGRRNTLDSMRMSRGTFARVASVLVTMSLIGVGGYVLNGLLKNQSSYLHREQKVSAKEPVPKVYGTGSSTRPEVLKATPSTSPSSVERASAPNKPSKSTWSSKPASVVPAWTHPKSWYETQCHEMKKSMETLCVGGYIFDRSDAVSIVNQIKTLQAAISENDASRCNKSYEELAKRFKAFSESCRWQQGLKHAKIPHIVSSYQRGVWNAEDGYEFVNPGTSDLTVREKVQQPSHPLDWYVRECDVISQNVQNVKNGPYYYDSRLANQVLTKARQLRSNLYTEKPNIVDKLCQELQQAYREFKSTCRWRSGVRHPNIAHVISSEHENTWNAESGWEFVHPGTSDLSVRKIVAAQRCNKCRGSGRMTVKYRCGRCAGNGRIKNPASEVGQAVKDAVGIFGGRNARHIRNVPTGPTFITCPDCGGRRFTVQETNCDSCGGVGQKYR